MSLHPFHPGPRASAIEHPRVPAWLEAEIALEIELISSLKAEEAENWVTWRAATNQEQKEKVVHYINQVSRIRRDNERSLVRNLKKKLTLKKEM